MKRIHNIIFVISIALMSFVLAEAQDGPPNGVATHIIVFNQSFNGNVPDFAQANGLGITHRYEHALNGVAAVIPAGRLRALQNRNDIAYIVENQPVSLNVQSVPQSFDRINMNTTNLTINSVDDLRVDVDVAVLDTGIDLEHWDLNVVGSVDCTSNRGCRSGGDDDNMHGTHVAGTIGALDNDQGVVGIAPGARLWSVKVLNRQGNGFTSWIVAGIDWVAAHSDTIEVANMSLGGDGYNAAEDAAIQNAIARGVVFVVAAGNQSDDASNYSPSGFADVITVSAIADFDGMAGGLAASGCRADVDDTLAEFSNYGAVVDIAAPGVCIQSTFPIENGGMGWQSGTSMAAPHVAGAAALLASVNNPSNAADVAAIRNQLVNSGSYDWVDDSGDGIQEPMLDIRNFTANFVANTGGGDSGGGDTGGGNCNGRKKNC